MGEQNGPVTRVPLLIGVVVCALMLAVPVLASDRRPPVTNHKPRAQLPPVATFRPQGMDCDFRIDPVSGAIHGCTVPDNMIPSSGMGMRIG